MSTQQKSVSPFVKVLLNIVASSLEQAGEPELVKLLQKQYEADPELYKAVIVSLNAGIAPLTKLVSKTPTTLDDGFVLAFADAIATSAAANGIDLSKS